MTTVELREITADTLRPILKMNVHKEQDNFVAPNSVSIAQAYFNKHAWFRGIYAGDEAVGFVQMEIIPDEGVYYVWRYMIAAEHQRKGYGKAAMELVTQYIRGNHSDAKKITLSHVEGNDEAGALYKSCGFDYTGEIEDGEVVMELPL